MIRLERAPLPADTAAHLTTYTDRIERTAEADRKAKAADLWAHTTVRRRVRGGLLATLADMAPGHQRCMYCGDSQGTDIDHFEPKSLAPLRTFEWFNHLLACAYCNSNRSGTPSRAQRGTAARSFSIPHFRSRWSTCG
ncbi:hypothetical protein [Streptomyces sp. NPDC057509]|uniref:hypothetical protein n=1 Tax=Streptomyces sp. NPDC057509 TaxID=3346152 RepID=UPI0036AB5166